MSNKEKKQALKSLIQSHCLLGTGCPDCEFYDKYSTKRFLCGLYDNEGHTPMDKDWNAESALSNSEENIDLNILKNFGKGDLSGSDYNN